MSTAEVQLSRLPTISELCLSVPLFHSFHFDESNVEQVRELIMYKEYIDCYCMECQQSSVFHVDTENVPYFNTKRLLIARNEIVDQIYNCSRDDKHILYFSFRIHEQTLMKIGQYPTIADLAAVEIQKYRKVLGTDRYAEFNRAVGLTSHGVGIGAFVYLRRIFEDLIEEAHRLNISSNGWDEDKYQRGRMDDRIELLKHSLPKFLVQNKSLYSILSKGLHELEESECLDAFPITKLGIELILDEKLEKLERQKKIKQASKDIGELTQKLKSKDT
ncbi:hypothetical protein ES703_27300 [subsurface metagenome]